VVGELTVAVGVPTYNRGSVLLATLAQILALDRPPDEIIVVDQSDWYPEGVRERVEELGAAGVIRYIYQRAPNLPAARNRILAEARSDVVIFIDDDVELAPGFVTAHARNYYDDTVWAVGGRVRQRLGWPRRWRPRRWRKELDYRFFNFEGTERRDVGSFPGMNHSVRRRRVLELGGYDEGYTGVALREEGDLALRILEAGGRIVFEPDACLLHLSAPAGGCRVAQWGDMSAALCNLRFVRKHWRRLGWVSVLELWHTWRLGVLNREKMKKPAEAIKDGVCLARAALALLSDRRTGGGQGAR
jgi:glycosyltransferase involved in cell wall biosynthesis